QLVELHPLLYEVTLSAASRSSTASSRDSGEVKAGVPVLGKSPMTVSSPVFGSTQRAWTVLAAVILFMRREMVVGLLRYTMTLSPSHERAAAFRTVSPPAPRAKTD